MAVRYYSRLTAESMKKIREEEGISLQELNHRKTVSIILDDVDAAETVEQLRQALSVYITYQTGIR